MEPREDAFGFYERASGAGGKLFRDRRDAGVYLASALAEYRGRQPLILGIPRGGVPVAYEVAQALGGELDVIVARKVGAPGHEEFAIGAVAADGTQYVNPRSCALAGVSETVFATLAETAQAEAARRERRFRGTLPPLHPAGRIAIVVDDGLATGATMFAAVRSLKRRGAEHIVVAVPVGAPDSCSSIAREVDRVVCSHRPAPFFAVGNHYQTFEQTSDAEVERLLHAQRGGLSGLPQGVRT